MTVYGLDSSSNYTTVVKQWSTAIGKTDALTPVGKFSILSKERWHFFNDTDVSKLPSQNKALLDECVAKVSAQYAEKYYDDFTGGLYIHSPLFYDENNKNMSVNSYNEIGLNATSGCFRTYTEACYWIYENCAIGTVIEIVNGSPKGTSASRPAPLDPSNIWDPTDPF
jgi:lipoprotein-anchoring transpeptidase ErfK/SrfK